MFCVSSLPASSDFDSGFPESADLAAAAQVKALVSVGWLHHSALVAVLADAVNPQAKFLLQNFLGRLQEELKDVPKNFTCDVHSVPFPNHARERHMVELRQN